MAFRPKKKNPLRHTTPKYRINHQIRAPKVRVLGSDGEEIGVMSVSSALVKANDAGLDLVEISAKSVPPVCKIVDYGKMLYAIKKKTQANKKATKIKEIKGVRLTFKMDVGDLERQREMAQKFLGLGHSVRIQMKLRGREKAHTPLAIEKLNVFLQSLSEISTVDLHPKSTGFQITAILKPITKK